MSESLVRFITDRLDEEAEDATAVGGSGRWCPYVEGGDDGWAIEDGDKGVPSATIGDEAMTRHMVRQDPARTLADIQAKRRIVELCSAPLIETTGPWSHGREFVPGGREAWAEPVLRELAQKWADHDGFEEDWRL